MTKELTGKTALVTGGARGIGRGIAERLAASGALVAVNYASNVKAARDTVAAIEAKGGQAFAVHARIGESGAIETLVTALDKEFTQRTGKNGIDILINNIGGGEHASIETTTAELLHQTFSNNVYGPFLLTQALLPRLNNGGRVINISSAASRLEGPTFIAYCMAKAAVEMFTRVLAKELGPRLITVNSVAPGYTASETNADVMENAEVARQIAEKTLFGRFGEIAEIADFVHALASPAGRWITYQNIEASGGFDL